MTDILPIRVVVPTWLRNDKIEMFLGTAEMSFNVNNWQVKFDIDVKTVDNPDGVIYDQRFRIRSNHLTNDALRTAARQALGNPPKRKGYVIFVCDTIVNADNMHTDTVRPTGTNGESLTSEAISFLSLIGTKSFVGDGDARTWTHEIGHGLGLVHVDNESNLMSPSRHGTGGHITGFDIAPEQIATMRQHWQNLTTNGL